MAEIVGSMTRILRTEYYEQPCDYSGFHRPHLRAVMGSGGGGGEPSYRKGNHTKTELITYENWCPGIPSSE